MDKNRPHILFAWELGANFGHASSIAEVARALRDRARVTVVAKDLVAFRAIAPDLKVDLLQAPRAPTRPPPDQNDVGKNYPDDLRHVGWDNVSELTALAESWDAVLRLANPNVVAIQAAPTAALACHGADRTLAHFGNGYDLPPRTEPLPAFLHWAGHSTNDVAAREAQVLANANRALAALGRPSLARFRDLFAVEAYLIASFPETDPYAPRDQFEPERPAYYGQLSTTDVGVDLAWRDGGKRKLFGYLRPAHAATRLALEAVRALPPDWDCILSIPGLPAAETQAYSAAHVRIVDGPVRLDGLLKGCDLALSHGGGGAVGAFLAAGVPQVLLPNHVEQVMTARALAQNQLSIGLVGQFGAKEVRDAILRIAGLPPMAQKARQIAKRFKRDGLAEPGRRIADALIRLASPRARPPAPPSETPPDS